MTWFWKKAKEEHRKLEAEISEAAKQLRRAEKAEVRINNLHQRLKVEVDQNHMGDRLKASFRQSRRRPDHGSASSV